MLLSISLTLVISWMLTQEKLNYSFPIKLDNFTANLMSTNVISSKPLHTKIVDKSIFLNLFDILQYFFIWNCPVNKSQSNWETITSQFSKSQRIENALKTTQLDFFIPILASLLTDHLFSVGMTKGNTLSSNTSLVLVTSNLESLWLLS